VQLLLPPQLPHIQFPESWSHRELWLALLLLQASRSALELMLALQLALLVQSGQERNFPRPHQQATPSSVQASGVGVGPVSEAAYVPACVVAAATGAALEPAFGVAVAVAFVIAAWQARGSHGGAFDLCNAMQPQARFQAASWKSPPTLARHLHLSLQSLRGQAAPQ